MCSPLWGRGQEGRLVSFGDLQRHSGDTHRAEPECSRVKTAMLSRVRPVSPVLSQPHSLRFLCCRAHPTMASPAAMCLDSSHRAPVGGSQGLFVRAVHSSQGTGRRLHCARVVNTQDPLPTAVQCRAHCQVAASSQSPVTRGNCPQPPFCKGAFSR